MQKFFRKINFPAYLIMAVITLLSSMSSHGIQMGMIPYQDKLMHFTAFGALSFTLCLWVRGKRWMTNPFLYLLLITAVTGIFGALDEFHQGFVPYREVSIYDWFADVLGGFTAALLFWKVQAWRLIPGHLD